MTDDAFNFWILVEMDWNLLNFKVLANIHIDSSCGYLTSVYSSFIIGLSLTKTRDANNLRKLPALLAKQFLWKWFIIIATRW